MQQQQQQVVGTGGKGVLCRTRPLICPFLPAPFVLPALQYSEWVAEVLAHKAEHPLGYPDRDDVIMPQHAIEVGVCACGWAGGQAGAQWGVRKGL